MELAGRLDARALLKLLRPHQWSKNVLVFVPVVAAGLWAVPDAWAAAAVAFAAFCLVASAGYVVNDLRDADEDARHPTKRHRPIASGRVARGVALALVPLLALPGLVLAASVDGRLLVSVGLYLLATLLYSHLLKHYFLADVMFLAALYTLRIVAGCAAVAVVPSVWLLSFSMFTFFSLALAKRVRELQVAVDENGQLRSSRDYRVGDHELLRMLGVASAGLAALVIALYLESEAVAGAYASPSWLWFVCPILWYWLARIWFKAGRGELEDDPVVFAFRDRGSWYCLGAVVVAWGCAVLGVPSLFEL